ncbi:hypothetical protein NDU88_003508 [Pleurodeles waltl]|uniref:Uncharacterized protein n=1 Tax=Pleurodeles waltl TaxID=8319 RepID=A0AAV7UC97_PLEWA|nr:hypothetical protein NDU88_003508 [Pleurodeles waltl]
MNNCYGNGERPSALEDKLDAVLLAIDSTRTSVEAKIDMVSSDLGLLHADDRKLGDRVALVEQTVMALLPRTDNLETSLKELKDKVRMLEQRAEDAEGRSHRNNVRLVGLPEGTSDKIPCSKSMTGYTLLSPQTRFPNFFPLSERIGCPMVIRFLHYRDRDVVLKETRSMADVLVVSTKVMFFPDYTIAVQKQHYNFLAVKQRLHEMEFTYSLLFPAKLCVVATDTKHFFTTPEEAWHWIEGSDNCTT